MLKFTGFSSNYKEFYTFSHFSPRELMLKAIPNSNIFLAAWNTTARKKEEKEIYGKFEKKCSMFKS